MNRPHLLRDAAGAIVLACVASLAHAGPPFPAEQAAFFEGQVIPILKTHCFKCHGGDKVRGGLRLTSREGAVKGGDSGPAVDLQNPQASRLLRAVNYQDGLEMPPNGKLAPGQIDVLTRWVKMGVPWSASRTEAVGARKREKESSAAAGEAYWAYQPVKRPAAPRVKNSCWVRNPIDAFIAARRERVGLSPAPPADRVAFARRAFYDLTGLPPTPEEVDAFVNDRSKDADERLIDRLLSSPHYGEKSGRHWLDLVRYAETNGYERDGPKPFAWRYRDYVIRAFNQDKPYDQFIKEQLAGDEASGWDADAIIAAGYYRLGLWDDEPADPKQARYDELDDFVSTTAQGFLGMTMNCARCHDHKRDPIPQADYYRFLAFFQDVPHFSDSRDVRSGFNIRDITPPDRRAAYESELKEREARTAELIAAMRRIEDGVIRRMPAEDRQAAEANDRAQVIATKLKRFIKPDEDAEYAKLKRELNRLRKKPEPVGRELALSVNNSAVNPPETHLLVRGSPHAPGVKVEPGFPQVLGFPAPVVPKPRPGARSSGRRTVLADWIASPENPLTARVLVNRLWQHHFGRGIVPTPSDFGRLGEPPTHPELLDWLADEFVRGGWRVKRMHKLIMLSNTYRMSAKASEAGLRLDPANTLHWRFAMRRLTAEEVRDSMLAVSGRLNLKAGGPSVCPPLPPEVLAGQSRPGEGWDPSPPGESARRSVYVRVKRSLLVPVLATHDQADTDSSCPVRYTTTVPTQALGLMNGEFSREQAAALARRLRRELPNDLAAQVRRAIRLTTGRVPGGDEVSRDVAFVREIQTRDGLGERGALTNYCLLVLNANEFFYLD